MDPNTSTYTTTPPKKKKSKVWMWVLITVIIILIGMVAGYFINKNNQEEKKQQAANAAKNAQAQNQAQKQAAFNALANSDVPYVATVKSTSGSQTTTGTITSDGKGNTSYAFSGSGKNGTLVFTPDAYYACTSATECVKYSKSDATTAPFNPAAYVFDGDELAKLKDSANYKGQQACPSPATGTCDVWSVTEGGATSTIYVNTSTKKIARVTTVNGTTKNEVTYDYKNATVTVPTNATPAPAQ